MLELEEKKEMVILQYTLSYDIDIAMMKCDLTTKEKKLMLNDTTFVYRIAYEDALIREKLIGRMTESLESADDKLAHKAAIDLGNILWPAKFKSKDDGSAKAIIPDIIILKGKKPKEQK